MQEAGLEVIAEADAGEEGADVAGAVAAEVDVLKAVKIK